jgi:hypothetical protein
MAASITSDKDLVSTAGSAKPGTHTGTTTYQAMTQVEKISLRNSHAASVIPP